jgi:large subunit ribosomal protein L32e
MIQTRALELGLKVLNAKDLTRAGETPAGSEEEVNEDE